MNFLIIKRNAARPGIIKICHALVMSGKLVVTPVFNFSNYGFFIGNRVRHMPTIRDRTRRFDVFPIYRKAVQRQSPGFIQAIFNRIPAAVEVIFTAGSVDNKFPVNSKSFIAFEPVRQTLRPFRYQVRTCIVALSFAYEPWIVNFRLCRVLFSIERVQVSQLGWIFR